jgi:ERCC4-type nuclease
MEATEQKTVSVVCDSRELKSHVPMELEKLGASIEIVGNMEVSDYCVSDRMAFERKTCTDFLQDWITSRELFPKLIDLKSAYPRSILLLEGYVAELFELRGIDPQKVQACLFTIARMGIPLVETINSAGTARALYWFGDKEQNNEHRVIQLHGKRSHFTPKQTSEYIVSAIPGIGRQTAIDLLIHFGNIEAICRAGIDELMCVDGVGEKTASAIRNIVTENYNRSESK